MCKLYSPTLFHLYFHFCQELAQETSSTAAFRSSLQVHDPDHTLPSHHGLVTASIQNRIYDDVTCTISIMYFGPASQAGRLLLSLSSWETPSVCVSLCTCCSLFQHHSIKQVHTRAADRACMVWATCPMQWVALCKTFSERCGSLMFL